MASGVGETIPPSVLHGNPYSVTLDEETVNNCQLARRNRGCRVPPSDTVLPVLFNASCFTLARHRTKRRRRKSRFTGRERERERVTGIHGSHVANKFSVRINTDRRGFNRINNEANYDANVHATKL